LVTPQIIQRLDILNKSNFSKLIIELLHFFADTYKKVFKFEYPPLHDPLAVSYVINPSLFETVFMRVDIEISSELCSGRTVCDIYHLSNKIKNIYVAQKVDIEGFWDLMIEALFQANSFSPLNKKQ
jgi:inosine-uridine nucleoside N-ribohydrolase